MRLFVTLLVFALLAGCSPEAQSQEKEEQPPSSKTAANDTISRSRRTAITRAVQSASPAVVSINVIETRRRQTPFSDPFFEHFFGRRPPTQKVQNVGSGFILSSDGYIVTNDHVAGSAEEITVSMPYGETLPAKLVGSDPATDIALLKVDAPRPLDHLPLADEEPIVGEWVVALGNPFGLFKASQPSVTVGVVSAVGRDLEPQGSRIYRDMIQTDASINRGNSGGPLVNAVGEVIGVNSAIYSQSGGSVGIGFAVPAPRVRRIVKELREKGYVDRSYYTGLYTQDVDQRIARALDLEAPEGVIVRAVETGSPGAAAGFRRYDVITAINDETVSNRGDLIEIIYEFRPGDVVTFEVLRDGTTQTLEMRLGRRRG